MARSKRFPTPATARRTPIASKRRPRLTLQTLEDRTVPTTDFTIVDGAFTITNGANETATITLDRVGANYTLKLEGGGLFKDPSDSNVTLSDGDTKAELTASAVTSFIFNFGNLDDNFVIASGTADGFAPVTVNGGAGAETNKLTINDSTSSTANSYLSLTNVLERTTGGTVEITYSNIDEVVINAGTGDDTIAVNSTTLNVPVTVNSGDGNDNITIEKTASIITVNAGEDNDSITVGRLDDLGKTVTVHGDGGTADQLVVDDHLETTGSAYLISDTSVERPVGTVKVDYSMVEGILLKSGTSGDTITATGAAAGTALAINSGNGNDNVFVEATAADSPVTVASGIGKDIITVGLANALAAISVDGGTEATNDDDQLLIDDGSNGTEQKYTITGVSASRDDVTPIVVDYTGIERIKLTAGSMTDTVAIDGTSAPVTVNGGGGVDSFTIGTASGLSAVLAAVTIDGDGGADTLFVDDSDATVDHVYDVTSTTISRTDVTLVVINYTDIGQVSLAGGSDGDSFVVTSTTVPLTVTAGAGNDTVIIKTTASSTTVNGGEGNDTINVGYGDLGGLVGALLLDPGAGTDLLVVDDHMDALPRTYEVTDSEAGRATLKFLYREPDPGVKFEAVSLKGGSNANDTIKVTVTTTGIPVEVDAGDGGNVITVNNTASPTTITGGTGADAITIENTGSPVTVNGAAGNDTFTIKKTGSSITVNGGDDNDTFTLGNAGTLDNLSSPISIVGGDDVGAVDKLVLNDNTDATDNAYTVAATFVKRTDDVPSTLQFDYLGIEQISLKAGGGGDAVSIGVGSLDGLGGLVTVAAGAGTDTLTFNDSTDADGHSYTISSTSVTRDTDKAFHYDQQQFERIVLMAGTKNDSITVSALPDSIAATVNAGLGNDTINVGNGALDAVGGALTLDAGPDVGVNADVLVIDDFKYGSNNTYTISQTGVGRSSAPGQVFSYSAAFEALQLKTGKMNNTVEVNGTAAGTETTPGTALTVTGGVKKDTIKVDMGSLGNDLIVAPGGNDGGAGDILNIFDLVSPPASTYTILPTSVSRGELEIFYGPDLEGLTLTTANQENTFKIDGTAKETRVTVTGGTANDFFMIGGGNLDSIKGEVTIDGKGLTNSVVVNDSGSTAGHIYSVAGGSITRTSAASIAFEDKDDNKVTSLLFKGGAGADKFTISSSTRTNIEVQAGDPATGALPGDVLFAKSLSQPTDSGDEITFPADSNNLPIKYSAIETVGFDTPVISLIGTPGADTFVLTASATEPNAGTYTLNSGLAVPFQNLISFKWTGGAGADTFRIVNPAIGLFAPTGGVQFVSDGDPGDKLEVQGGTANSGTFQVGPTAGEVRLNHTNGAAPLAVKATGLPTANAVLDTVLEPLFTVFATDDPNAIAVTDNRVTISSIVPVSNFVPVDYFNKGRLIVRGGDSTPGLDKADTISVNLSPTIVGLTGVDVLGEEGDESISILAIPQTLNYTVNGGQGNDTTTIGDDSLADVLANGTVAGGTGADLLLLDDAGAPAEGTYLITKATARLIGAGAVAYETLESIVLNTAVGDGDFTPDNTINIQGTAVNTPVTVNAGPGDDRMNVSSDAAENLGNLLGLSARITFNGGGQVNSRDSLVISAAGSTAGDTVDIYSTDRVISGTADGGAAPDVDWTINTNGLLRGGITVLGGSGPDKVKVAQTSSDEAITVNTGEGSDKVTVGDKSLDRLGGTLTLDAGGGTGTDVLIVDDSGDTNIGTAGNVYEITENAVSRNDPEFTFNYYTDGFEQVDVRAGTLGDTISITSTRTGIPVAVNGGGGDDTITANAGFDKLLANVALDGGTGTRDRLDLDDSQDNDPNEYLVTSNSLVRADLTVAYGAFDEFALTAGTNRDKITVRSTTANVLVTVNGGDENDTIIAGGGTLDDLRGTLIVDGGNGEGNRLVIDDSGDANNNDYSIGLDTISRVTPLQLQVDIRYLNGFKSVSLLAGDGNDSIDANSSDSIEVSVDGGDKADAFMLGYLNGNIFGGAGADTIATADTVGHDYELSGADAGTIKDLLKGSFVQVENLTAGSGDDSFKLTDLGSLTGALRGGAGGDIIIGNDVGQFFSLAAKESGNVEDLSVKALIQSFSGVETLLGGAGPDTLIVHANVLKGSLAKFDGGSGDDTLDFSRREVSHSFKIAPTRSDDGFNLNEGSSDGPNPSAIVTDGYHNINRVLGSGASTDTLTGIGGVSSATWEVNRGADPVNFYKTALSNTKLDFENFEHLVGSSDVADTFTIQFPGPDIVGTRLLLDGLGGDKNHTDLAQDPDDLVEVVGGDGADTFVLEKLNKSWPADDSGGLLYAGVNINAPPAPKASQPVLYVNIEILDLQGGEGNDTFTIEPTAQAAVRATTYLALYGDAVRTLRLTGGGGADTFSVVPDRPGKNKKTGAVLPGVTIQVYGGSSESVNAAPATRDDVLTLIKLVAKYKANFPVAGGGGPQSTNSTAKVNLHALGFKPVEYYDMWTVTAWSNLPTQTAIRR